MIRYHNNATPAAARRQPNGFRPLSALLILLLLFGCQATSGKLARRLPPEVDNTSGAQEENAARLSVFLNLKSPSSQGIRMDVTSIEILADDVWMPITSQPIAIDASAIGPGQLFLGRCRLPGGRYQKIRLGIERASILKRNGDRIFLALASPTVEINIPNTLTLAAQDSQSLFIIWDEEESLRTPPHLRPLLTIPRNLKQMPADLAYAACPEINTVYVIRTDKNWVCDSFGVTGHPTYLTAAAQQSKKRLYLLSPAEAEIKVVELPANNLVDSFPVPMTSKPSFMALSDDARWAYVLDAQDDYLLRIDLDSGNLANRVHLGYEPKCLTYIGGHNLLAVGATMSQTVSLLDANTLAQVGEIPTNGTPEGLLAWENLLYISEGRANTVMIYDLNHRAPLSRLNVGFFPYQLFQNDRHIYVGNRDSNSLSILQPGQFGIAREIDLGGRPLEMTADVHSRWLYVGNQKIGGLSVIDATTNRVSGEILFGAVPKGLAVLQ